MSDASVRKGDVPVPVPLLRTPASPPPVRTPSKHVDDLRGQVGSVVNIMQSNLDKVMERGDSLQSLANRSQVVNENSVQFRQNTAAVRRKLWWKNMKMNFIICLFLLALILVLVFVFVLPPKKAPAEVTPPGNAPGTDPEVPDPVVDPNDQINP